MSVKSRIFDEKVWKIGKNGGLRGCLREKGGFPGFRGGKVEFLMVLGGKKGEYLEGFPLMGDGFWVK